MPSVKRAMDRVEWGDTGKHLTRRMAMATKWAHARFHKRYPDVPIYLSQGSFNTDVPASAGTHDGAGAADWSIRNLTVAQRKYLVRCYKLAGLAPYYRTAAQGFSPHLHVLDKNTTGMGSLAKWQVEQYAKGRSGLSSNLPDRTWRAPGNPYWNYRLGRPVQRDAA